MNKLVVIAISLIVSAATCFATDDDTLSIDYSVEEINEVNLHLSYVALTIGSAIPGQQPNYDIAGVSHDITTNGINKKLTGVLDGALEDGVTITASFHSDRFGNGLSTGERSLSTDPVDLLTGISHRASSAASNFRLYADVSAGIIAPKERIFTLTLTDGAD
ncbi:MAG TPA: hypothetical protein DEP45_08265 [Armatimonadetes bacterium]|nr:hypothetical protein [Armatimonadota bacterium]